MGTPLQIFVSEDGAEADRLDELTGYLRQELLQLDVDDVTALPTAEVPSGARAAGVVEVGALLVSLSQSATVLRSVLGTIWGWWGRCRDSRPTMRLVMDGDVLEISEASSDQAADAFALFVSRHTRTGA